MCLCCEAVSSYFELGSRDAATLERQPERPTAGRRLAGQVAALPAEPPHPETSPSSKALLAPRALSSLLVPQREEKRVQAAAENNILVME